MTTVNCAGAILAADLLLTAAIDASGSPLPDCAAIITTAVKSRNGWTSFRDARVAAIDRRTGVLAVSMNGKQRAIYFNGETEFCNAGKPGSLREIKSGDPIGGFTRLENGHPVAVILGYGVRKYSYGIPVSGRLGWVRSPFAPSKPAINATNIPSGGLMKCPYTGQLFKIP